MSIASRFRQTKRNLTSTKAGLTTGSKEDRRKYAGKVAADIGMTAADVVATPYSMISGKSFSDAVGYEDKTSLGKTLDVATDTLADASATVAPIAAGVATTALTGNPMLGKMAMSGVQGVQQMAGAFDDEESNSLINPTQAQGVSQLGTSVAGMFMGNMNNTTTGGQDIGDGTANNIGISGFSTGGWLNKYQNGGEIPQSNYYRLYGHAKKYTIGESNPVKTDPDTGYGYFENPEPEGAPKGVPNDIWNTSRFLYQPYIAMESQGAHNAVYDENGKVVGTKELYTDSKRENFKAAKEDITNYYTKDLGQSGSEARKNIRGKMHTLREMNRAQSKMGNIYFKAFESPEDVFNDAATPSKYKPEDAESLRDVQKGYVAFQKAWRDTTGKEARQNAKELKAGAIAYRDKFYTDIINEAKGSENPEEVFYTYLPEKEAKQQFKKFQKTQLQNGGKIAPYVTSNPNDPRIQEYNDSLALHNEGLKGLQLYDDLLKKYGVGRAADKWGELTKSSKINGNIRTPDDVIEKDYGAVIYQWDAPKQPVILNTAAPRKNVKEMPRLSARVDATQDTLANPSWHNKLVMGANGKYVPAGQYMQERGLSVEQMFKSFPSLQSEYAPEQEAMKTRVGAQTFQNGGQVKPYQSTDREDYLEKLGNYNDSLAVHLQYENQIQPELIYKTHWNSEAAKKEYNELEKKYAELQKPYEMAGAALQKDLKAIRDKYIPLIKAEVDPKKKESIERKMSEEQNLILNTGKKERSKLSDAGNEELFRMQYLSSKHSTEEPINAVNYDYKKIDPTLKVKGMQPDKWEPTYHPEETGYSEDYYVTQGKYGPIFGEPTGDGKEYTIPAYTTYSPKFKAPVREVLPPKPIEMMPRLELPKPQPTTKLAKSMPYPTLPTLTTVAQYGSPSAKLGKNYASLNGKGVSYDEYMQMVNANQEVIDYNKTLQNGGSIDEVSRLGYSDNSPYKHAPYIDIHTPTGEIDMTNTGIPLYANGQRLEPYSGVHKFNTTKVREVPISDNWLEKFK